MANQQRLALAFVFLLSLSVVTANLRGLQSSTLTPSISANWAPNTSYQVGAQVSYNGALYKCIQTHNSILEWNPQSTPALWQITTTTCTSSPSAPSGLAASSTTSSGTTLTWSAVNAPSGCNIIGYSIIQNGVTVYSGVSGTSYGVSGLSASSSYTFAVAAVTSAGASSNSNSITVMTSADSSPQPSTPVVNNNTPASNSQSSSSSKLEFAPYVDMGLYQTRNLSDISAQSGVKKFTLAFIQGFGGCTPTWSGQYSVPGETEMKNIIESHGKENVIISFGGASGTELAEACGTVAATQAAYQSVIDYYGVMNLDFDIEGHVLGMPAVTDIRNQALANLQKANPGLVISYTLPAVPTGLGGEGVNLMVSAQKYGVNVDLVNLMCMDYGSYFDPTKMADHAINAVKNTMAQLAAKGLSPKMGITPMIGLNDVIPENFSLQDAQTVVNYARSEPRVQRLSMWSIARDNGNCVGTISYGCSGIQQNAYDFARIFNQA